MFRSVSFELREWEDSEFSIKYLALHTPNIDVKMMVIREFAKGWVFHLLLSNLT